MNEWHNKRTILFYVSAECCPTRSGRRGFPQIYAEGERRCGRDALSNTSSECVVAKANEADCGAQTPKSKHVRKGGSFIILCFNLRKVFIINS